MARNGRERKEEAYGAGPAGEQPAASAHGVAADAQGGVASVQGCVVSVQGGVASVQGCVVGTQDAEANARGACGARGSSIGARAVAPRVRHPPIDGPRWEIERGDALYPAAFELVSAPPKHLYLVGDPSALSEGLAVVGARKATPYGLGCARRFARIAARRGVVIVSGGARGCDAEAHRAALAEGGRTVAFLGGGCDKIYPAEHRGLFQDIVNAGGALVSEHPWEFPPVPYAFRARNRLIAGLARATLIVEAGLPSGTFSTADEALSAGREVLVVPGAITSASSRGANRLLYQGAMPIVDDESFADALFSIFGLLKQEGSPAAPCASDASCMANARGASKSPYAPGTLGALGTSGASNASAPSDVSGAPSSVALSGVFADDTCNEIVRALRAEPMDLEELYVVAQRLRPSEDARAWLMECMAVSEAAGIIARYPDGRWGPAARA